MHTCPILPPFHMRIAFSRFRSLCVMSTIGNFYFLTSFFWQQTILFSPCHFSSTAAFRVLFSPGFFFLLLCWFYLPTLWCVCVFESSCGGAVVCLYAAFTQFPFNRQGGNENHFMYLRRHLRINQHASHAQPIYMAAFRVARWGFFELNWWSRLAVL